MIIDLICILKWFITLIFFAYFILIYIIFLNLTNLRIIFKYFKFNLIILNFNFLVIKYENVILIISNFESIFIIIVINYHRLNF